MKKERLFSSCAFRRKEEQLTVVPAKSCEYSVNVFSPFNCLPSSLKKPGGYPRLNSSNVKLVIECGSSGTENGRVRRAVYSSSLMSLVRIRLSSPGCYQLLFHFEYV
jgi:hypothetical protein